MMIPVLIFVLIVALFFLVVGICTIAYKGDDKDKTEDAVKCLIAFIIFLTLAFFIYINYIAIK